MKKTIHLFLLTGFLLGLMSCERNEVEPIEEPSSTLLKSYIAGTISPEGSSRYSPFLINFKKDSIANFINSTSVFSGKYRFKADTLIFQSDNKEKVAKFVFQDDKVVYSSYEVRFYNEDGSYDPAPVQYEATAERKEMSENNRLAGKVFKGELYKFGTDGVFLEGFTYKFSGNGNTYSSGATDIGNNVYNYQLFNNVAFRFEKDGIKEFGVIIDDKLVTFKVDGLYYWGAFHLQ